MYEQGAGSSAYLKYILHSEGKYDLSLGGGTYLYHLKDHLGNTRLVVVDCKGVECQQSAYYPFGMSFMLGGIVNNSYLYNGKELQEDLIGCKPLDWYDYGARMYDASLGRWHCVDPLAEKYPSMSPYNYCANNPINAIDPDGCIIIFINGFTLNKEQKGSSLYWGGFDDAVMRQLSDRKSIYKHGGTNLFAGLRILYGFAQGKIDAPEIIKAITGENGQVLESVKIITHSMGGAFGKGYALALQKYFEENGHDNALITLMADFDPYQASKLSSIKNIHTVQFTHKKKGEGDYPWLANEQQNNLNGNNYFEDEKQGAHSIESFLNDVSKLQEGEYRRNEEGKWILQKENK